MAPMPMSYSNDWKTNIKPKKAVCENSTATQALALLCEPNQSPNDYPTFSTNPRTAAMNGPIDTGLAR